jgi:hypothetical protein
MLSIQDRETCVRLKLIGRLTNGDKICVRWLAIQPNTVGTMFSRWAYGENRRESVSFVRNTVYQAQDLMAKNTDAKIKSIIKSDLTNARLGIVALQTTYLSDVRIYSELQEIIESLT